MKCPKPTQDVALNLKNRQKAIDDIGYGPLNPSEENDKFWQKKADSWDVSIADAKKQLCGNCAGFNRSKEMLDCIDKGMGEKDDSWDVIDAGQLGYCEPLDFKCAASRTCDAWIDGNAKKNDEKVALVEAYFRKVDEFLAVVDVKEDKPTGEVMFGSELREGMTIMLDGKRTTLLRFGYTQFAPGGGEMWLVDAHVGSDNKDVEVEIHAERSYDVVKGSGAEHVHAKSFDIDPETKVRKVRDADFWGVPVGTPITPGMKPRPKGDKTPNMDKVRVNVRLGEPKKPSKPGKDKDRKPKADATGGADSGDGMGVSKVDTTVRKAEDFSVKSAAEELGKIKVDGSKDGSGALDDPIDCGSDIEMAHKLLAEGKHVRLDSAMEVSVLMDRIADEAAFAKQSGGDVPDYDLCKISVPKTNLFCLESKGIPRVNMPQFSGAPVEGSYAATKYDEKKGESNIVDDFAALLDEMGIGVEEKDVKVTELKASQNQLVGTKVAGMRKAMREGKIKDAPIYVTRDGYIVDGHHRWAAKMGLDLEDGKLGDVDMPVLMIDAEIGYILDLSNGFTEMAGIKPKATGKAADGVKSLAGDWAPCIGCEGHVYDSAAVEEKIRRVRDSGFWGLPVGTPIKPGMKPRVRLPKAGSRDEMLPPGAGASRALKPSQRVIDKSRAGSEVYRATDSRGGEASVEKLVGKDKKPIFRVTYQSEKGRTAYEVFDDEASAKRWLDGRMFGVRQEEVGGAKPRTPAVKTPTPDYKVKKSDYEGWDLVSFDVGKGTDYYVGQDDDGTWMATEGDSWSKVRVSGKRSKKEALAALQSIEGLKQHRLNIAKEGKGRPGARIMVRRGAKGPGKAFEGNEESKPRLYKLPPSVVRELGYRWEETDDPTKRKWRVSGDSVEVYGEDGRKEILNDVDYYIDVFDSNAEDASGPERAKLKRMADSLRKFKANLEADAPEKPKKAEGEKPVVGPGSQKTKKTASSTLAIDPELLNIDWSDKDSVERKIESFTDDAKDALANPKARGFSESEATTYSNAMGIRNMAIETSKERIDRANKNQRKSRVSSVTDARENGKVMSAHNLDGAIQILKSKKFKTQFETKTSNGILHMSSRAELETGILGVSPKIDGTVRPVYGYVTTADGTGTNVQGFGSVRILLKPTVRSRTTMTFGDSLEGDMIPIPLVGDVTEDQMLAAHIGFDTQSAKKFEDSGYYIEAQIHNGVTVDDIAAIYVIKDDDKDEYNLADKPKRDELSELAKSLGIEVRYYDGLADGVI